MQNGKTQTFHISSYQKECSRQKLMVHTRYTLEIINGIVGAILALLRGRVFVRWFGKGVSSA